MSKPMYEDHCGHERDHKGSFYMTWRGKDVYFYQGGFYDKEAWQYCCRNSNSDENYTSGSIVSLTMATGYSEGFTKEGVIKSSNDDRELLGMFLNFLVERGHLEHH